MEINKTGGNTITADNQAEYEMQYNRLLENQNLAMGIIGGLIGAVVFAVAMAFLSVTIEKIYGIMIIGGGVLVGLLMRIMGKGIQIQFRIIGAVLTLVGCALGMVLTYGYFATKSVEGLLEILQPAIIIDILTSAFEPVDVVFYGLAVYIGFMYSADNVPTWEQVTMKAQKQNPGNTGK